MGRYIAILAITMLILPVTLMAGVYGKVMGRVIDIVTGKPLEGANVILIGTNYGAATDKDGYYHILKVLPGYYDIKVTMMGYRPEVRKNIHVAIDLTTKVDFKLTPTPIEIERPIVVVAKRPLVIPDMTSSTRYVTKEDIESIPNIETFTRVVELQPGVVDGHFRGGRSEEALYTMDGLPIRNPVYGGRAAFVLTVVSVKEMEVLTGGFSAEYGEAQSGVVNIVTREGGTKPSIELEYKTDRILPRVHPEFPSPLAAGYTNKYSENMDYLAFAVGGPMFGNKDLRYFVSGSGRLRDGSYVDKRKREKRVEILPGWKIYERQYNHFNFNTKLTYEVSPNLKFNVGFRRAWGYWYWFDWTWVFLADSMERCEDDNYHLTFNLIHTLSPKTFYTLRVGWLKTYYHQKFRLPPEYYHWEYDTTEWVYDTIGINIRNVVMPETSYVETLLILDSIPKVDTQYVGEPWGWDINGDGFVDTGAQSRYREDHNLTLTVKWDLSSQVHRNHFLKTGVEYNYYDVSFVDLQYTTPFYYEGRDVPGPYPEYGLYRWVFTGYPKKAAAYVQDKMEFEGLVINTGVRVDYFDPGPTVDDTAWIHEWERITDLEIEKIEHHRFIISPRLGVSFPISERTSLYFAYGHFNQMPELQFLYRDPFTGTWVGNPNLKPQRTVAYEFGIAHQFAPDIAVYVKLYNKDMFDYPGQIQTGTPPVWVWVNKGYARARGFEFQIKKRFTRYWWGEFVYTYQWATGYASSAFMECYRIWGGGTVPVREHFLDWDRRHSFILNLSTWVDKGERLVLPFDRWGINILAQLYSGLPYTPEGVNPSIAENTGRLPWVSYIDVKIRKEFNIGRTVVELYSNIMNLLDQRNAVDRYKINGWTGKPYQYGDADGRAHTIWSWREILKMMEPNAYSGPRRVNLGVRIKL